MKNLVLFISAFILSLTGLAQPTFQKIHYGSFAGEMVGNAIKQTVDNGYIITGTTENFGAVNRDVFLMKLNSAGDTVWTYIYGNSIGSDDWGFDVIQTQDSGFAIAGMTDSIGDEDMLVFKTDSLGNLLWAKNFGEGSPDQANAITQLPNGNLVIAGQTASYGAGAEDGYVIALTTGGTSLWAKTYGGADVERFHSIAACIGGGLIIGGESQSWVTQNAYIVRTDNNGDTLWTKMLGGSNLETAYSVEQIQADSGFIVGGETWGYGVGGADMFMARLDSSGTISWFKTYGTGMDDKGYAARETNDGGFILGGYSWDPGGQNAFIVKTNGAGDSLWTRFLGAGGDAIANDIQTTNDGGYVFCGWTFDAMLGYPVSYVVKLNNSGIAQGCYQSTSTGFVTDVTPSIDISTPTLIGSGNMAAQNTPLVINSVSPIITERQMVITFDSSNVSCLGGSDGVASAITTCGVAPYTYSWSPSGSSNDTITGLTVGTYTVTVTDNGGSVFIDSVQVTEPVLLTVDAQNAIPTTCDSLCIGEAMAMESGGTWPFTYTWDNAAGSQTDVQASGLCIGVYFVTITDGNGCTASDSVIVESDPSPAIIINSYVDVSAACSTACNAVIISASNGISPFTYLWDDPAAQTTDTAWGLCVGEHVLKVWDGQGCITYDTTTITAIGDSMSLVMIGYDRTCNLWCDGAAGLGIAGNIPGPFQYSWNDPAGQTTNAPDSLCAGTYTVVFSDVNGCFSLTDSVTINNSFMSLDLYFDSLDASCLGVCDGQAEVFSNGAFPVNMWLWDDSAVQTTASATGLCGGTYTVIATDDQGCARDTASVIISDIVPIINVTTSNVNVICNGICDGIGTVSATATYPPVSYSWDDPGTQTSDTAVGLCPGTFTVSTTDSLGCVTEVDTVIVDTDPFQPEPICVISVDSTSTKNVIVWEKPATAGIDSFKIYRDIVGIYTLVGSQPYATETYFEDTTSGINPAVTSYRYKISTVDTCGVESVLSDFHKTIHLQVVPGIPPAMQLSWDDYEGFSLTFYRILRDTTGLGNWEKIDSTSFGINSFTDPTPPQTGFLRYIVEVVAPAECVATKLKNFNSSKSNTAISTVGSLLSVTTNSSSATFGVCNGNASANPMGGTSPYTYSWNTSPTQTNANATGLCGNTSYTVLVTDASGDTISSSVFISESGTPVSVTATTTDASSGLCNGTATAVGVGGASPYTYSWNTSPVQTNATAFGLCGNTTYTVSITDASGDTSSTSVLVPELTSIDDQILNKLFEVYPNPNTGSFTVDLDLPGSDAWTLSIFNILGTEVLHVDLGVVNGNLIKAISLPNTASGILYVQLSNEKVSVRKKVVIY